MVSIVVKLYEKEIKGSLSEEEIKVSQILIK